MNLFIAKPKCLLDASLLDFMLFSETFFHFIDSFSFSALLILNKVLWLELDHVGLMKCVYSFQSIQAGFQRTRSVGLHGSLKDLFVFAIFGLGIFPVLSCLRWHTLDTGDQHIA